MHEAALAIWHAGLEAVRSDALVQQRVAVDGRWLIVGPCRFELERLRRMVVVGAGKAGAGMASGLERAVQPAGLSDEQLAGWINVPADCSRPLQWIKLHAARSAGQNEPTADGVYGSNQILSMVDQLNSDDLCICLISGGGSALLPAPRDGVRLDDLLQVTRALSSLGATIHQLNAVRKRLSRIQGGQLANVCPP